MDSNLSNLLLRAESVDRNIYEKALLDLRLVIERYTQNRYDINEIENYMLLFNEKNLINMHLHIEDFEIVKYFLFFSLLNFLDRSILISKCIKVLYDVNVRNAICTSIEFFMLRDDDTTSELILALTDMDDFETYLSEKKILNLFMDIYKSGGSNSRQIIQNEFDLYNVKLDG